MTTTIGNPGSWGVGQVQALGRFIAGVVDRLGRGDPAEAGRMPAIRRIETEDLREALRRGLDDFAASRSDVIFLCLLYPVIGIVLAWFAFDRELLPLLFPVMSGFALVGPLAAVGLYEMSRRREQGHEIGWTDAFRIVRSPSFGAILVLGLLLLALFVVWILAAGGIYALTLGPEPPASLGAFLRAVFTTGPGWAMIVLGMGAGFLFAALVLAASLVSFPLLLDREVGLPAAVGTSLRVALASPGPVAVWGLVVALGLALGSLPAFLGLVVVIPVLGHATWHLYRRAVVPEGGTA